MWVRDVSRVRSNASSRRVSSRRRPTMGIVRRTDRVESPSAGQARTSPWKPRAGTIRDGPNATDRLVSCQVTSSARHLSGLGRLLEPFGEVHGRAGHRSWSGGPDPVATGPVARPTRTRSGAASVRPSARRGVWSRIKRPARRRAKGVGLVRLREAEHRHRRVAHELLGPSPEGHQRVGRHPEERGDDLAIPLGI